VHHGYGLFLSISAASIVVGAHWRQISGSGVSPVPGLSWLRSCGRLSYEIYLSHMFCVFGGLAIFNAIGLSPAWRFLWYVPMLLACWLLGVALSRGFTLPVERFIRHKLRPNSRIAVD
jgi:peptidoglycan/LPS O-acetylase OafA/YrhL